MTAAIGALLIAALVSGCDEDGGPDSAPPRDSPSAPETSSPTEPPTTTPTETGPVEPTRPAEADGDGQAAAEAFVRFYWDVVNYATKSGDVALLKSLDQPSCAGCDGGIRFVEQVYASGGRVVGGDYRVVGLESAKSPSGDWAITTHTKIALQKVVGAGDLNQRYPAGRGKWLVAVTRFQGSWSVATLEGL